MTRFVAMNVLVFLALATGPGCFEDSESADIGQPTGQDAYSAPDIQFLQDAMPLGDNDVAPDAGPVPADVSEQDPGPADPGSSGPDTIISTDTHDDAYPGDITDLAGDTSDASIDIPDPQPCGIDNEPCDPDHICVQDAEGVEACMPVGECSDLGIIDELEMIRMLFERQELYIKVKAQAWIGNASCTFLVCPQEDPCCNTCFAQLFIGTEFLPIVLLGKGLVFGCHGNECNMDGECRPLEPGAWYWIWGTASIQGGKAQFQVDGFCPSLPE